MDLVLANRDRGEHIRLKVGVKKKEKKRRFGKVLE